MSNLPVLDINCDMGESFGAYTIGHDQAIFPYISSCNIACGFHGGDPYHIEQTIRLALQYGVRIGAHPGYPDLAGFGRRPMQIPARELKALLKYQIAALKGMTESLGGALAYVKPHGALYNTAADDLLEAHVILDAIQEMDPNLALMGLAGSSMEQAAAQSGIAFIAEAFADRRYTDQGRLVARTQPDAVLSSPEEAAQQVCQIVLQKNVRSHRNNLIPVYAQSVCIHGDNPQAVAILEHLDQVLPHAKIQKAQWR